MAVKGNSCTSIEQVPSSPGENSFLFTVPNQRKVDVPKRFRYETLDKIPLLNYKTESWELTGTLFDGKYFQRRESIQEGWKRSPYETTFFPSVN
jgi:hypothetical protein